MVSDVLLEYQQCQMECAHDMSDESDYCEDIVPVADQRLSSSKYGSRGSVQQSALLPSDAEQMLRVRMSMPHARQSMPVSNLFTQSLREETNVMPLLYF